MSQSLKNVQAKLLKADNKRLRAALEGLLMAIGLSFGDPISAKDPAILKAQAALKEST